MGERQEGKGREGRREEQSPYSPLGKEYNQQKLWAVASFRPVIPFRDDTFHLKYLNENT